MSAASGINIDAEPASLNVRNAPVYDRPADDWYVDPVWCTELLLKHERFVGEIYDPCAGGGNIVTACRAAGLPTKASDIAPKSDGIVALDFLSYSERYQNIIFNPPYKDAERFIRHALSLATSKVAALVQQQFPFSQARHRLFTETPVARLYLLSTRPSMPPGRLLQSGEIKAAGGKTDYLWIIWDHDHKGPPQSFWLKREAE